MYVIFVHLALFLLVTDKFNLLLKFNNDNATP
jgi:hypothetical protein